MGMRVSAAAAYWMLIVVTLASVTGKPVSTMRTQKRQSDQRVAELETLLALQKYGAHHFIRDGEKSFFPAYGIIDFNKIGRKKKSSQPQDEEVHDWLIPSWASPSSSSSPSSPRNPSSETTRLVSSSRSKWKATHPVQLSNPEDGIGDK